MSGITNTGKDGAGMIAGGTGFIDPFQKLAGVLDFASEHRNAQLASTQKLITRLKTEWVPIQNEDRERNVRENHHFNPLRNITIKETDHSRILGELLDPRGSHGQGSLFLDAFLQMIGIIPGGNWRVAVESGGRVDILLRRCQPLSVVLIENKAHNAIDQSGQLYRYWHDHIHSPNPDLCYADPETARHFRVVYLPPGSFSRPAEISIARPADVRYQSCIHDRIPLQILDCRSFRGDIADWLHSFEHRKFSPRLKSFLNFYTEIWSL